MASVDAALIHHQGSTPKRLAVAAPPVILGTTVSRLPRRTAPATVATCVPSYHWCLGLAGILHSRPVCSAASYRLKPSVLPKTLCWRCSILSHWGALMTSFCPGSKEVWDKKAVFQGLHDKAEGGNHSKAMLVRSLLRAVDSLKLHSAERKWAEQGFQWIPAVLEITSKGVSDAKVHRAESVSKPYPAPWGLRDQHDLNYPFSALVQVT